MENMLPFKHCASRIIKLMLYIFLYKFVYLYAYYRVPVAMGGAFAGDLQMAMESALTILEHSTTHTA